MHFFTVSQLTQMILILNFEADLVLLGFEQTHTYLGVLNIDLYGTCPTVRFLHIPPVAYYLFWGVLLPKPLSDAAFTSSFYCKLIF